MPLPGAEAHSAVLWQGALPAHPPLRWLLDVEVMFVASHVLHQVARPLLKGPVSHQICLTGPDPVWGVSSWFGTPQITCHALHTQKPLPAVHPLIHIYLRIVSWLIYCSVVCLSVAGFISVCSASPSGPSVQHLHNILCMLEADNQDGYACTRPNACQDHHMTAPNHPRQVCSGEMQQYKRCKCRHA